MRLQFWFARGDGLAPAANYAAEILYANAMAEPETPTGIAPAAGTGHREIPDAADYLKRFYSNQDC